MSLKYYILLYCIDNKNVDTNLSIGTFYKGREGKNYEDSYRIKGENIEYYKWRFIEVVPTRLTRLLFD